MPSDAELHARWAHHARAWGAALDGAYPAITLRGVANGFPWIFCHGPRERTHHDAEGRHVDRFVLSEATCDDPPRLGRLGVVPETTLHSIVKLFGGQDIVIGHRDFDAIYVVNDADEAHARALLGPRACAALVDAHRRGPPATLLNGRITSRAAYPIEDPQQAYANVLQVTWIASQLGA